MPRTIFFLLTVLLAMLTGGAGCEKSQLVDAPSLYRLDTFPCPEIAERCPRLAAVAAAAPIRYDSLYTRHALMKMALYQILHDSIRTALDYATSKPGLCPDLTRADLRCILGEPDPGGYEMLFTDGTLVVIDNYSMTWDPNDPTATPRNTKFRPPFPSFEISYYADTKKISFVSFRK